MRGDRIVNSEHENGNLKGKGRPACAPLQCPAKPPRRILVVDDDNDARKLIVDALAAAGYDVEGVKDGAAGWESLQANSYDLIVTDNKMPRVTGIEMIEKLQSACMAIPVIMATGCLPTDELARKPWLTPDAMLQRPHSDDDLLAAVKEILRAKDAPRKQIAAPPNRQSQSSPTVDSSQTPARNEAETSEKQGAFAPSHDTRTVQVDNSEQRMRASELSYRRLFEAAQDGILILDVDTGRISDVNPFLVKLLGYYHGEMVGQTVGEISPFKDLVSNQAMLERLQRDG